MSVFVYIFLCVLSNVYAGPATEAYNSNYKDQFCTDPRTMRKHAAYTEWADAYSCTRHRCQPGGRNLAIYTVGCKRVEAPESAIECEEVVEDTNMQFPYCCTRLRCLVVVRGEVWTRVLGQPWETLPAAPWSHMYKMKKPPPADGSFLKNPGEGPVYELQTESNREAGHEEVLRAARKPTPDPEYNEVAPRAAPAPDIVIALSTNSEKKDHKKDNVRHKRGRKTTNNNAPVYDDELPEGTEPRDGPEDLERDGEAPATDKPDHKPAETLSEERFYSNAYGVTQRLPVKIQSHKQVSRTEIPQSQWNEHDPSMEPDAAPRSDTDNHQEQPATEVESEDKPGNLQALVDAIGTRMRDIENVVQRMSEKVKPPVPAEPDFSSGEKRLRPDSEINHKEGNEHIKDAGKMKKPNPDSDHYKRFSVRNRDSKYLHSSPDTTTEHPLFVEDTNLNGYFNDASNHILRRGNGPKEPEATYMAPVSENLRKSTHVSSVRSSEEEREKKHKKHTHKRKRARGSHHRKHHGKDDKRKRFNRLSMELDKNVVSLEDSSTGNV